jgi:hypothetical protein
VKRFSKYFGLATLAFVAAACQADDGGVTVTSVPPLAFVRYINAVPDSTVTTINRIFNNPALGGALDTTYTNVTHTTTVRFTDGIEYTPQSWANVNYGGLGAGNYQGLRAGTRSFKIFTFDPTFFGTNERVDTSFNFVAGNYYTIVHYRNGTGGQVVILSDTLPAVNATAFQYRARSFAATGSNVDFWQVPDSVRNGTLPGTPFATNVAPLGGTAYQSLATDALVKAVQASNVGATTPLNPRTVGTTTVNAAAPLGGFVFNGQEANTGSSAGGSVMTAFYFPSVPAVVAFGDPQVAAVPGRVIWIRDRRPAITP